MRTSILILSVSAASFLSMAPCDAAGAGRGPREVEAAFARAEKALAAISGGGGREALGGELGIALRREAEARAALRTHRLRRARESVARLEAQVRRLEELLPAAEEEAGARAARDAAFALGIAEGQRRARDDASALESKGALLTSAFPPLETGGGAAGDVERAIEAGRRRAAAGEGAREEQGGAGPRLTAARREVGRGLVARAKREAGALRILADRGAAMEEQAACAVREVGEAEAALARDDFAGVQRGTERVAALLCRALAWAYEVEGPHAAERRAAIAGDLRAAGLADVAGSCGVRIEEAR